MPVRRLVRCHANRAENRLGVVDVDEAEERHAQKADRLLTMDHRDHARSASPLKRFQRACPAGRHEAPSENGEEKRREEKDREEVAEVDGREDTAG